MQEKYVPSSEEIKKTEEMIINEEKESSEKREQELQDQFIRKELLQNAKERLESILGLSNISIEELKDIKIDEEEIRIGGKVLAKFDDEGSTALSMCSGPIVHISPETIKSLVNKKEKNKNDLLEISRMLKYLMKFQGLEWVSEDHFDEFVKNKEIEGDIYYDENWNYQIQEKFDYFWNNRSLSLDFGYTESTPDGFNTGSGSFPLAYFKEGKKDQALISLSPEYYPFLIGSKEGIEKIYKQNGKEIMWGSGYKSISSGVEYKIVADK